MDLRELDDPKRYRECPEEEVFDEHEVKDASGKVVKRVTREDLDQYAANSNERARQGSPSAMTIGHTIDPHYDEAGRMTWKPPEDQQPPIIGFYLRYRVRWNAVKKKYSLYATPYIKVARAADLESFPRVSVEAWKSRKIIDPVARLRVTPDRPVHTTFAATGERYQMAGREERYRYSMETGMAEETTPATPNSGTDPAGPPSATAPSPEELDRFMKCAMVHFPNLKAMHDKYVATPAPAPAPAAPPAPAPAVPAPPEHKDKMSALEAQLAEERRKGAATAQTLELMQKATRQTERKADLEKLRDVEKYALDVERELKDVEDLAPDKYAAHLDRIRKHYRQDPSADRPWVQTEDRHSDKFGAAEQEKANALMIEHHDELQKLPSWEARWGKCRSAALTGKWEQ